MVRLAYLRIRCASLGIDLSTGDVQCSWDLHVLRGLEMESFEDSVDVGILQEVMVRSADFARPSNLNNH